MADTKRIDLALLRFRRFVRRLAPYRPFSLGSKRVEAVLRQFVLCAAHDNGGQFESCTKCQDICEERWGLELEREELSRAIKQLVEQKRLIQDADGFRLSVSSSNEIADRVRTSKEVEAAAFAEWTARVKAIAPTLTDKQIGELQEDLTLWLQKFIVEYGVEAALVLYPEQQRFKARLEELKHLDFEFLPHRHPAIMKVRKQALKGFIDYMTPMQRQYFDNLVVTAYLMSVFTLEPEALDKIREHTNGQVVLLDTNIVYSLMKLNGARAYAIIRRILALSRYLGYRICITEWTLREMEESVRKARRELARHRHSPQSLIDIPLDGADLSDEIVAGMIRRRQRDAGFSFEEFFGLHEQIARLLAVENVEVISDGCDSVRDDKRLFDEEIAILERLREGPEKRRPVQEHDIRHFLLINKLRGRKARELYNPGYIMLTNDRAVVEYAKKKNRGNKAALPYAISISAWGDIVRALVPRTKNYDDTTIKLLHTLSFRASGAVSQAEVIEALRRIELQEQYPDSIQASLVVNIAFGGDIAQTEEQEAAESEAAAREREAGLKKQNQELHAKLAIVTDERDLLENRVNYLQAVLDESEEQLKRQTHVIQAVDSHPDTEIVATADLLDERDDKTWRVFVGNQVARVEITLPLDWVVSFLTFAFCTVIVTLPLIAGWIPNHSPLRPLHVCVGVGCFTLASGWRFGIQSARAFIMSLSAVICLIAAIYALFP